QLNAGIKATQPFVLKLQNCSLNGKTASIQFNSNDVDGTNAAILDTRGTATGLGIGIQGYTFGTAAGLKGLVDGNNDLAFTAVAQQKVAKTNVTAGDFTAATNFVISYK
ncbi:type 1 fimbrial protein, partial [Salmonella enterica subsp. enterica serovar Minnesota]|nr:type 1 fimbrial protein [Salmonella enterica subsp. enterica serovar Minnesota]